MTQKIEVTFLGTGSAIPTQKRNHVGILISFGSENILVDCGEGIQRQFRIAKISLCKLTRIFLTHWHADHTLGLPGLLQTREMSECNKTIFIYGPRETKEKISLFEKIYGKFRINYEVNDVSDKKFLDGKEYVIETLSMSHRIPTNAYSIILKDKLRLDKKKLKKLKLPSSPLLAKLQQGKDIVIESKKIRASSLIYTEKGKKLTIILDTEPNYNAVKIAKKSDLLICESSFSSKEKEKSKQYKHLTAIEAATIAKKAKAKKLVLLHLSQRYDKDYSAILKEARSIFKNTTIAKDFDKIIL